MNITAKYTPLGVSNTYAAPYAIRYRRSDQFNRIYIYISRRCRAQSQCKHIFDARQLLSFVSKVKFPVASTVTLATREIAPLENSSQTLNVYRYTYRWCQPGALYTNISVLGIVQGSKVYGHSLAKAKRINITSRSVKKVQTQWNPLKCNRVDADKKVYHSLGRYSAYKHTSKRVEKDAKNKGELLPSYYKIPLLLRLSHRIRINTQRQREYRGNAGMQNKRHI